MPTELSSIPRLFISHKHVDSKIADAIRSFVTMHSGGRVDVFQSSSPWADAPKVGRNLNKQLREALWKTSVVILVYTESDQDWSYCMWECGVASHPQSPDTSIVLFQCTGSSPVLFAEQVNVNARDFVDIQKFVDQFLTSPDFFPGFEGPVARFAPHGQEVASAAADFFQKLSTVLPPEEAAPSIEWPTQPFLQLELPFSQVEILKSFEAKARAKNACKILQQECVISATDKYCEQLFGVPSFSRGMTLRNLVEVWREGHPESESKWVRALCRQLIAGVMWKFPPTSWEIMQGLSDSAWRAPVLNRIRRIPGRECMQFDVYFYKFDVTAGESFSRIVVPGSSHQARRPFGMPEEEDSAGNEKATAPTSKPFRRKSTGSRKVDKTKAKVRKPKGKP